jgi:hypothetical protein
MEFPGSLLRTVQNDGNAHPSHTTEEWAEVLARTIAHLAAQLTMTQLRLRALASELEGVSSVDRTAVRERLAALAATETPAYLRENLGDALAEVVDVDALSAEIASFLAV